MKLTALTRKSRVTYRGGFAKASTGSRVATGVVIHERLSQPRRHPPGIRTTRRPANLLRGLTSRRTTRFFRQSSLQRRGFERNRNYLGRSGFDWQKRIGWVSGTELATTS